MKRNNDMKNRVKNKKLRFLVVFFILIIIFCIYIACKSYIKNNCLVNEDKLPMASSSYNVVTAHFYLNTCENEKLNLISILTSEKIGKGYIAKSDSVWNDEDKVKKLLIDIPSFLSKIPPNKDIKWMASFSLFGSWRVIGILVDKPIDDMADSSSSLIVQTVNSVADMIKESYTVGTKVKTLGYYSPDDGGSGEYLISDDSSLKVDNGLVIELANGLKAQLQVNNNKVIVEQFGAHGDGYTDDSKYIQAAINSGFEVNLTTGKKYRFINSGIYLTHSTSLHGNGATFVVDDAYNPEKYDFVHYFIRYVYGSQLAMFCVDNLNIEVSFSDNRFTEQSYVIISPLYIDNVILDNVCITTNQSCNKLVCVWIDRGCSSFILKDSKLYNNTTGSEGTALWLTSKSDELFGKFNTLDFVLLENSILSCTSADETLAIWGTNDAKVTVNSCIIQASAKAEGRTRPICIYSEGDNNANFDVRFNECIISAECDKQNSSSFYDSLIGVGSNFPSNKFNIFFNSCKINARVNGSLIFPICFDSDWSHVEEFDATNPSVRLVFNDCSVDCNSTITGASHDYFDTAKLYPAAAWNCEFNNCIIKCDTAFAYLLYRGVPQYFIPEITLNDSLLTVKNAKAVICKSNNSTKVNLSMKNTWVNAIGIDNLVMTESENSPKVVTQKNSIEEIIIDNSYLNGEIISTR